MVSIAVASRLAIHQYHRQRTCPNSDRGCIMGTSVVPEMYLLQIRQHGGGGPPEILHLTRGPPYAPVALPNVLLSLLSISLQGGTRTRH